MNLDYSSGSVLGSPYSYDTNFFEKQRFVLFYANDYFGIRRHFKNY